MPTKPADDERVARKLRAKIAAHSKWARTDPVEGTARARAAFQESFLDRVDPRRELDEPERLRRAEHARSEHYTRLALKSVEVRRRRRKAS